MPHKACFSPHTGTQGQSQWLETQGQETSMEEKNVGRKFMVLVVGTSWSRNLSDWTFKAELAMGTHASLILRE